MVAAVNRLRDMDLAKPPGVAETIDWVNTLGVVGADDLDSEAVADTLGAVIKDRDDLELVRATSTGSSRVPVAEQGDDYVAMLVDFARTLRDEGLNPGSGDVLTYTQAVGTLDPTDLMDLYWAGRTTLVSRRDHVALYHRAFERYFLDGAAGTPRVAALQPAERIEARAALEVPETEGLGEEREQREARLGLVASGARTVRRKDFGACTPEELAALRRILRTMRLTPPRRRSRRTAPGPPRPRSPTYAGPSGRPCASTASPPSCSGAAAGCGTGRWC